MQKEKNDELNPMIVKLTIGNISEKPIFLNIVEFIESMTIINNQKEELIVNMEAVHWSDVGRIGSIYQVGNNIYVKVKNINDDPFKYYTPKKPRKMIGYKPIWGEE